MFHRYRKNAPIHMEPQKFPKHRTILRKKSKAGGITLSDFKLYCKAVVIKTELYGYRNRYIYPLNGTAIPEIEPCTYG